MVVEVIEGEKQEKMSWMVQLVEKSSSFDDGSDSFLVSSR